MEFRKALAAATIAGAGFGFAGTAVADHVPGIGFLAQPFTFDATAYGGTAFTARFIDFSYEAEVDQTGVVFDETGVAFFGTFRTALGQPPIPNTGLGDTYNMYAIFDGSGTVAPGGGGSVDGTFTTFNARIFIDPNQDTVASEFTVGPPDETKTVSGNGDDVEILQGTLLVGGFHVFPGLANGDFDVQFIVTEYDESVWGGPAFAGPTVIGDINGVNTVIEGVGPPGSTFIDARIIGSGNVSFQSVPEPGSLSLLGLGLFGLGALLRTRRQRGLRAAA
jgi:hypothetical protein